MTLKADLLEVLSRLPAVGTADGRKALLLSTGFAYLGLLLPFDDDPPGFFSRLVAALANQGPMILGAFLEAVIHSPYADGCRSQLFELRDRATAFDEAGLAAELGGPGTAPIAPDAGMLAATLVLQVLGPYYRSGFEGLCQQAGGDAASLAGQVAGTVEAGLAADEQALSALAEFKGTPWSEPELITALRIWLEADAAVAAGLARLLVADAKGLLALAQTGWGEVQFMGGAVAAVVGREAAHQIAHAVGGLKAAKPPMAEPPAEPPSARESTTEAPPEMPEAAPESDWEGQDLEAKGLSPAPSEVTQTTGTVGAGGTVVGTVVGGDAPVEIGGTHTDTGGGAVIGGDAQAGGDLVGRDQVIHGNKITVESGGQLTIVTGGAAEPDAPLVEEKIRLDVAAPPVAELEEPFDLAVAVRQPDAPPLAVDDLTQVKSEEGSVFRHEQDEIVLYRVEVVAADCDVEPPHYVLKLRPRANSAPCWFQITPHRAGKQSVVVTAYQEDNAIAATTRLRIEVQVPVKPGAQG